MTSTAHVPVFDTTLQKTHLWLHELMEAGGYADEKVACGVLRVILHAIRDHLCVDEVADLAAEMPMLIRGLYYEQWKPSAPSHERTVPGFLGQIQAKLAPYRGVDAEEAIFAVFQLLNDHITPGELSDVRGALPHHIRDLWVTA